MRCTYIIPTYNESALIASSVTRICGRLGQIPASRLIIVDNGSSDGTLELLAGLPARINGVEISVLFLSEKGVGGAYARGVRAALEGDGGGEHWVVLAAADLPFGFSDLEAFLVARAHGPAMQMYLGSKSHPASTLVVPHLRRIISAIFRELRCTLLGSRIRDSQGSLFVSSATLRNLCRYTSARNYFYTTELVYGAERAGMRLRELAVKMEPARRPSKVRPLRDGLIMLGQLLRLWLRGLHESAQA